MESGIGKIRIPIVNGWESDSEEEMQEINFIEQEQDEEEEFVREESDDEDEDEGYAPVAATSNGLEHDDEKGEDAHGDEGDEEVEEEEEEEQEDGHTVPSLRIKIKGGDGIDEEDTEADNPFTDLPSLTFAYRRQFDDGHYHQEANAGKEELDWEGDVQENGTIYKDDDEEEVEEDEGGEDIDEKDGEYKPYARDLGTSRSGRKRVSSAIAASEEYVEYAEGSDSDDDERKKRRKKGSSKTSASKTAQAPALSPSNTKTTASTKHKKIKSEAKLVILAPGFQPTSTPKNVQAKSKGSARSRLLKKLGPKR
jgi:hypothetical protein